MIELTHDPINPQTVIDRVQSPASGAVVSFLGVVRGESQGQQVLHLEFEAHPQMAQKALEAIREGIKSRWGTDKVAISHRLGKVGAGEVCVAIAVGAPHRQEAFLACQFAIDRLKETATFWKKEVLATGQRWVNAP